MPFEVVLSVVADVEEVRFYELEESPVVLDVADGVKCDLMSLLLFIFQI